MSMPTNWLNENSGDFNNYDAVSFDTPGDSVEGKVLTLPRVVMTQFGERMVLDLLPDGDTEPKTLWIKPGAQARAITEALKKAGADGVSQNGRLKITYTGDGAQTKPGYNPPKLFDATYTAPGVNPEAIFGMEGAG